jgi:hypothetical protein
MGQLMAQYRARRPLVEDPQQADGGTDRGMARAAPAKALGFSVGLT